jgi:hypothetical protein
MSLSKASPSTRRTGLTLDSPSSRREVREISNQPHSNGHRDGPKELDVVHERHQRRERLLVALAGTVDERGDRGWRSIHSVVPYGICRLPLRGMAANISSVTVSHSFPANVTLRILLMVPAIIGPFDAGARCRGMSSSGQRPTAGEGGPWHCQP